MDRDPSEPRRLLGRRSVRRNGLLAAGSLLTVAACGSGGASAPELAACPAADATACVVDIDTLDSAAATELDAAVEFDAEIDGGLSAGACGRGGNGPDRILWSVCELTLPDGRQIVLGRGAEDDLTVRVDVDGEPVEFPLAHRPGTATLLASGVRTISIYDGDDSVGSLSGG